MPGCTCTGGVMLVHGVLTCATCQVPAVPAAPALVSTVQLPPDAKDAAAFNRACRTGRVEGAFKTGRNWVAPLEGWLRRSPATAPRGLKRRTKSATVSPLRPDDSVLVELGLGSRRAS